MKARPEDRYLPKGFPIEQDLRDQLSSRSGSQRGLVGHSELWLIVHEVPEPGKPEREPRIFWRPAANEWWGPEGSKGLRALERAAELLHHDAKLAIDYRGAEHASAQREAAERLHAIAFRLDLMAGFFLPLLGVGALLGMNVEIPSFVKPWFWGIFLIGLVMGGAVLRLVGWKPHRRS